MDSYSGPTEVIPASTLQVGDVLLLDTSSSFVSLRSKVVGFKRPWYRVENSLVPEPYDVFLPDSRSVRVLVNPITSSKRLREREIREKAIHRFKNWALEQKRLREERRRAKEDRKRQAKEKKRSEARARARKKALPPLVDAAYRTLGLESGSSLSLAKSAYKRLVLLYHPDRCKESFAEEKLKQINAAYAEVTLYWGKSS